MTPRRLGGERGYTLLEIAVAALPLAIIALTLFSALAFTISFSRRGEAGIESIREGRMALTALANELREASAAPGAVVIFARQTAAEGDGIGFLSARADGPGRAFTAGVFGAPRWQHAVFYIHDASREELKRITAAGTTLAWPPPDAGARIMARRVQELRVERRGDVVMIRLTVAKPSGTAALEATARPRN